MTTATHRPAKHGKPARTGYPCQDMFQDCLKEGFIHAPIYSWAVPFEAIVAVMQELDEDVPEEEAS